MRKPTDFMDWIYNIKQWTIADASVEIGITEVVVGKAITGRQISRKQADLIYRAGYDGPVLNVRKK